VVAEAPVGEAEPDVGILTLAVPIAEPAVVAEAPVGEAEPDVGTSE